VVFHSFFDKNAQEIVFHLSQEGIDYSLCIIFSYDETSRGFQARSHEFHVKSYQEEIHQ